MGISKTNEKDFQNGTAIKTSSDGESGNSFCSKILGFAIVYGLCNLVTQALTLYISSQITTLEKQYNLSSSESGIILSCNDIGFIVTVLFVSHFGKRSHIPRILGVSAAIYGISGVLSSLPPFLSWDDISDTNTTNSSSLHISQNGLCDRTVGSNVSTEQKDCSTNTSGTSGFKWIVLYLGICMAVQGVGKSPRSSLGTLYLDNNVKKTRTGIYLGIMQTIALFGPFLALILGGVFGQIPVNLQETGITPSDPRWVGAWWIGFLFFGGLALLLAVPVACFPRNLKTKDENLEEIPEKTKEEKENEDNEDQSFRNQLKELPKALLRLFTNPVYVFHLLGIICTMLSITSVTSFGPKYIENQFNLPTWKANIILGGEKLVTASIGTFLGGYLTTRLKLDKNGCFKMIAILHFLTSALSSLQFIFGCENPQIYGHQESPDKFDCNCENVPYLAVCGSDGNTYYSPCHAGCVNVTNNVYGGCSQVEGSTATPGICDTGCPYLIPYIAVSVVQTLVATMAILPVYIGFLRCVEERDRSLGMGILSFTLSLLVFIPGPIVLGKIIDTTCKIWRNTCDTDGACVLYDVVDLRIKLIAVIVVLSVLSLIFNILTLMISLRRTKYEKNEDGVELSSIQKSL